VEDAYSFYNILSDEEMMLFTTKAKATD